MTLVCTLLRLLGGMGSSTAAAARCLLEASIEGSWRENVHMAQGWGPTTSLEDALDGTWSCRWSYLEMHGLLLRQPSLFNSIFS